MKRRDVLRSALGAAGLLAFQRGVQGQRVQERSNLDTALRAERWIRRSRIETEHGLRWPADPAKPAAATTDLYNGFPGVVLFLLELFHTTGERRYLDEAVRGANELLAGLPADGGAVRDSGLYTGLAGIGFVMDETERASGESRFREASLRIGRLLHESAKPVGSGVEWSESSDIISGSAGIGLYLLRVGRDRRDREAVALAAKAGRRLLERGEPSHGGLKWAISPRVTNRYPNFSHGAAGVGYFLATLFQETAEPAFLNGALAAARYLEGVARKDGDGFMVFHHEPQGEDLYYLSWCHGPPGTARLFYRLHQVTRDPAWLDVVHRCARATIATGIPEQRTPGFWNNISQCCGNCGVGEFFLSMQRLAPRTEYIRMARRAAEDTLKRGSAEGDGMKWVQAEHRVQPQLLIAQTGFMQGAAGVGTYYLHLDAFERSKQPVIVFPDNPFA